MKTIKKVILFFVNKHWNISKASGAVQIDSYYDIMEDRISKYKDAEDFDPILYK